MDRQDDFALVRNALMRYRRIAGQHRRGGLIEDHKLSARALGALERLRQPALPDGGDDSVESAIDNPPVS